MTTSTKNPAHLNIRHGLLVSESFVDVGPKAFRILARCDCGRYARPMAVSTWIKGRAKSCGEHACSENARLMARGFKRKDGPEQVNAPIPADVMRLAQSVRWIWA